MEHEQLDQLARGVAGGISRRGLVRALAGAAAGSVLVAAGAGAAGAARKRHNQGKRRCKAPRTRCGKGKHAQCCSSGQICDNGACVTDGRTVTLTWNPWVNPMAPDDHGFCYPTVSVTGFAPGTYEGFASSIEVTVVVGADGTGSGSNSGTIIANNGSPYVATVDGVSSSEARTNCWAT
ncbi:MAG: hypothetical protein IT338_03870 [Thermomicrobiales bacterium]|nr:hypothetical protein [Thermomicrobiales bacterium]